MVNAEISVPTPGTALSALETPTTVVVAVLAGMTDPAKLAMSDLPRLSENGTL
jgi:hypothetical protein